MQCNGQSALIDALTGLRRVARGTVIFDGNDSTCASGRMRHRLGIAHIAEDRQVAGLTGNLTIAENMGPDTYCGTRFSKGPRTDWQTVNR